VEDKRELATYYRTAATLNDHYLERKEDALTYYELALDNDPAQFKLFDAMVTILTEKQDWKGLERSYQKMLDRLPEGVEDSTKANLYHSLGEVYHHRLGQNRDAINAYETALKLEPTQRNWQEVLADLYADDLRYSDKAVQLNREILQLNPFRANSYKTLCRLYRKKGKYDEAWCVADTLHSLNMADGEEMEIYEAYATEEPAAAYDRVNEDMWNRYLFHPLLDDKITGIFRIIEPAVIGAKGQSRKAANLDEEYKTDPENEQDLLPRTIHYAGGVLGMELPDFYVMRDDPDLGLVFAPTWPPAIAVGGGAHEDDEPQMQAFVAGRHLCYYMPGFQLRVFLQSGTALSTWILAAISAVVPKFPVPEGFRSKVVDSVGILKKELSSHDQETLSGRVQTFLESATGGIDLKQWAAAVDFTADRAGLLLCSEMMVATKAVKTLVVDSWFAATKDRLTELNLFSVSEDYFILRRKLGIAIETE
jgi:tetratricopeptide (TPR) repeat protein